MQAFRVLGTAVVVGLVAGAVVTAGQRELTHDGGESAALARLEAAIAAYVDTHRFREPIDLETLCLPEATTYTSAARLDEPPAPREGDVFTADVTAWLRRRLATLELQPGSEAPLRASTVAVGDPLAAGHGARLPNAVAGVLPRLPRDLQYRLVGADLVLLDRRTNVVVDALRGWRG